MNFLLPETQNRTKTGMIVISMLQAMRMIHGESENDPIKIEDASLAVHLEELQQLHMYAQTHGLLVYLGKGDTIPFEDGIKAAEAGGFAGVICVRVH